MQMITFYFDGGDGAGFDWWVDLIAVAWHVDADMACVYV